MEQCDSQLRYPKQCDQENRQMSIKVAQKLVHYKNDRVWHLYENCLRMWEIWEN